MPLPYYTTRHHDSAIPSNMAELFTLTGEVRFSINTKILANRAGPADSASPPHVIGFLLGITAFCICILK